MPDAAGIHWQVVVDEADQQSYPGESQGSSSNISRIASDFQQLTPGQALVLLPPAARVTALPFPAASAVPAACSTLMSMICVHCSSWCACCHNLQLCCRCWCWLVHVASRLVQCVVPQHATGRCELLCGAGAGNECVCLHQAVMYATRGCCQSLQHMSCCCKQLVTGAAAFLWQRLWLFNGLLAYIAAAAVTTADSNITIICRTNTSATAAVFIINIINIIIITCAPTVKVRT